MLGFYHSYRIAPTGGELQRSIHTVSPARRHCMQDSHHSKFGNGETPPFPFACSLCSGHPLRKSERCYSTSKCARAGAWHSSSHPPRVDETMSKEFPCSTHIESARRSTGWLQRQNRPHRGARTTVRPCLETRFEGCRSADFVYLSPSPSTCTYARRRSARGYRERYQHADPSARTILGGRAIPSPGPVDRDHRTGRAAVAQDQRRIDRLAGCDRRCPRQPTSRAVADQHARVFSNAMVDGAITAVRSISIDDSAAVVRAAEAGGGLALARWSLVADDVLLGRLAVASKKITRHVRTYYFVCPPKYRDMPKVAAFHRWLRAEAAKHVPPEGSKIPE